MRGLDQIRPRLTFKVQSYTVRIFPIKNNEMGAGVPPSIKLGSSEQGLEFAS